MNLLGYSMGSSVIMAALSDKTLELQDKIGQIILLGPTIYVKNHKSDVFHLLSSLKLFELFRFLGIYDFSPIPFDLVFYMAKHLFPLNKFALTYLADSNFDSCYLQLYPKYTANYPAGTSMKNYEHFGQLVDSGKFRKFDYGK